MCASNCLQKFAKKAQKIRQITAKLVDSLAKVTLKIEYESFMILIKFTLHILRHDLFDFIPEKIVEYEWMM